MNIAKFTVIGVLSVVIGAVIFKKTIVRQYDAIHHDRSERLAKKLSQSSALWAARVKEGGYILHFRHAEREKWIDVTGFDSYALVSGIDEAESSFYKATCLTERGKETSKLIGAIFTRENIDISGVYSSPSCRARQTAKIAFGSEGTIANSLFHRTAIKYSQHSLFAQELRALIMDIEVMPGSNVILSGHGGTLGMDGPLLIDNNYVDDIDGRDEGGFIVLSNESGVITAHYKFRNFSQFINSLIELPVN